MNPKLNPYPKTQSKVSNLLSAISCLPSLSGTATAIKFCIETNQAVLLERSVNIGSEEGRRNYSADTEIRFEYRNSHEFGTFGHLFLRSLQKPYSLDHVRPV